MAGMMTVAFAADTPHSITITNTNTNISINGKTYRAYKLFDSTHSGSAYAYSMSTSSQFYSEGLLSATQPASGLDKLLWDNFTFTANTSDNTKVNVVVKNGFDARAFADAIQQYLSEKTPTATSPAAANETTTITLPNNDAGNGYYIVTGTAAPTDGTVTPNEIVSAVILTNEDPNPVVAPKADAPQLDKKITGEFKLDEAGNAATAEIGKTVSFELDSNVPDFTGYTSYDYIIHDTMSSGLQFDGTVTVKIGGADFTDFVLATASSTAEQKNAAGFKSGDTFSVKFGSSFMQKTKGAEIVVTYTATVLESALNTNYEKNTANLEYSNNPYDEDDHNTTPDDTVYVIDINIDVLKIDGQNSATTLEGAQFQVFKGATQPADSAEAWYHYNETGDVVEWVARANADTFTTNAQGHFNPQVRGLKAEASGTAYGLLETVPPTGYNLLTQPIFVTLTGAYADASGSKNKTCTITASAGTVTGGTIDLGVQPAAQPVDELQVENNAGTQLPSTGGIGTTLFYIGGGILVLAAVILLITKRRMSANND